VEEGDLLVPNASEATHDAPVDFSVGSLKTVKAMQTTRIMPTTPTSVTHAPTASVASTPSNKFADPESEMSDAYVSTVPTHYSESGNLKPESKPTLLASTRHALIGLDSILQRAETTLSKIQTIRAGASVTHSTYKTDIIGLDAGADLPGDSTRARSPRRFDEQTVQKDEARRTLPVPYVPHDGFSADTGRRQMRILHQQAVTGSRQDIMSLPVPPLSSLSGICVDHNLVLVEGKRTRNYDLQMKLLLDGVPEAFIDEELQERDLLNDRAVDRILNEHGPKPSQIVFPTLYSQTQLLLSKLMQIHTIEVVIQTLFIRSVQCGVRRKGSFLLVKPPNLGTPSQAHVSSEVCTENFGSNNIGCVPLPEFGEGITQKRAEAATHPRVGAKTAATMAEKFFSETCYLDTDSSVTSNKNIVRFPVKLSDELIKNWLVSDTPSECLRLELYSPLLPESQGNSFNGRNKDPEAVLFAQAHISLRGLLSTLSLEATATCPLVSLKTW
jgi:hypothetical protein